MRFVLNIVLASLGIFVVVATILPFIRHDQWWIRIFDFPRVQIAVLGLSVLVGGFFLWDRTRTPIVVLLVLLGLCVVYQVARMYPYSAVSHKQVEPAAEHQSDGTFSLLIANVLMTNRESDGFIDLVKQYDPDVILTVETDLWWQEQLDVLEMDHPHSVKAPLDNTYGMLLYSRLQLINPEVKYIVEDDIPSIHTTIVLPNGRQIQFRGIHPRPPYPKEAKETTDRDAEILIVGREVKSLDEPVVVAGDLNDVAWSHTTGLFQKVSGLLDPRRGRGLYSTFHAEIPVMRWPLDHVFHSNHFTLVDLQRLPAFGSDHFPVFIKLNLEPGATREQERPKADVEEQEEAEEKIEKAEEAPEAP